MQSIERQDFSQARKGYDPDEVDAHLTAIAAAVAELQELPPAAPRGHPRSPAPRPNRCA